MVFAAHCPPRPGRPPHASPRFRVREAQIPPEKKKQNCFVLEMGPHGLNFPPLRKERGSYMYPPLPVSSEQ